MLTCFISVVFIIDIIDFFNGLLRDLFDQEKSDEEKSDEEKHKIAIGIANESGLKLEVLGVHFKSGGLVEILHITEELQTGKHSLN